MIFFPSQFFQLCQAPVLVAIYEHCLAGHEDDFVDAVAGQVAHGDAFDLKIEVLAFPEAGSVSGAIDDERTSPPFDRGLPSHLLLPHSLGVGIYGLGRGGLRSTGACSRRGSRRRTVARSLLAEHFAVDSGRELVDSRDDFVHALALVEKGHRRLQPGHVHGLGVDTHAVSEDGQTAVKHVIGVELGTGISRVPFIDWTG